MQCLFYSCSNPLLVDNKGKEASFSSFLFGSEVSQYTYEYRSLIE